MKKLISTIIFCWIFSLLYSQEFSTTIYFSDNVGNTDSIIVGYDPAATDSVDTAFGEVNIIDEPWDTVFDVRITDEMLARNSINDSDSVGNYHLKKQIVQFNCDSFQSHGRLSIDILCKHWPVTAYWDSSIFNLSCINGSVLTSVPPGGWWDVVGSPSNLGRAELSSKDSVTFSSNYSYGYINEDNDTISVFLFVFEDSSFLDMSTESKKIHRIKVYPNPVKGEQIFLDHDSDEQPVYIELIDLYGRVVYKGKNINNDTPFSLTLPHNFKGTFFLRIHLNDSIMTKKILKL